MEKEEILEHIIVIEIFILLTILAFHKLFILGISEWVIGDHGDAWQFIWNFWWVKKALTEGRNLFYTDYLFYPQGTHLYFHTLNLSGIFMIFPLLFLTENLKLVYNISVLSTFVLSGYFMYIFLRYFLSFTTKSKGGKLSEIITSFIGGLFYTFSSYHVSKAIALFNFLSIQWFPLYFLLLFKLLRKFTLKNGIIYFILSFLILFTEFQYFYYTALITIIILAIEAIIRRNKNSSLIFFIFLLSSFPLWMILSQFLRYEELYKRVEDVLHLSFINYFIPAPFTILGNLITFDKLIKIYNLISPTFFIVESVVNIPYSVLILIALTYFKHKKSYKNISNFYFSHLFYS